MAKRAWTTPAAREFGSFAHLTRELITVCQTKILNADDGGQIGQSSIGDDPAVCS